MKKTILFIILGIVLLSSMIIAGTMLSSTIDKDTAKILNAKGIDKYTIDRCFIVNDCWRCMIIFKGSETFSIEAGCQNNLPSNSDLIKLVDKQLIYYAEKQEEKTYNKTYEEKKKFERMEVEIK